MANLAIHTKLATNVESGNHKPVTEESIENHDATTTKDAKRELHKDQQAKEKLVSLHCHLGPICNKGKNGTTWRTIYLTFNQALEEVHDDIQYAHTTEGEDAADTRYHEQG